MQLKFATTWLGACLTRHLSGFILRRCFFLVAPGDYDSVTELLTFSPSMTRQCVEFTGKEDGIVEPNENFTVTLTSGDEVDLNPDVAVVTIVEGVGKQKLQRISD